MEAHIQQLGTPVPLPRKDVSVLGPVGEQIEASRDLSDKMGVTADIEKMAFSGMTASRIAEALKEKLEAVKSQAEGNPESPYHNKAYFVRHVRMSLGVPPVENEAKFNAWREQAPTRLKYGVATVQPSAQDNAATSQPSVQPKGNANDEEAKRLAPLQKADEDKTRPRPQPATDKKPSDNTIESNEIFTASQTDIKPIVPQEIEKHENKTDDETTVPRRNDADAAKPKDSRAAVFRNRPPEEAVKAHPELAGAYATVAALDKKAQVDGLDEKQRSIVSAIVREFVASNIERGHIPNTKLREDREVTRSRSNERDYSR